jgi:hypothetical protein
MMPKKEWRYERDAGPSTASLVIRLRETPLRMTGFSINQLLTSCQFVDTAYKFAIGLGNARDSKYRNKSKIQGFFAALRMTNEILGILHC